MHSDLVTTRGCNIYVLQFFFSSFLGGTIVQLMIDSCSQIKWNIIGLWFWLHLIVDILLEEKII